MYTACKFIHLLGVVLLLGNITVTAVWKVFADRSSSPSITAFAQRLVTGTDWSLTLGGVVLTMLGGYGMAIAGGIPLFEPRWLLHGQLLFYASGLVWLCVLLPIQVRQARMAHQFAQAHKVPEDYRRLSRLWLIWGLVATTPLLLAMVLMIMK